MEDDVHVAWHRRLTDNWNAVRLSKLVVELFIDAEWPPHVTRTQRLGYTSDDVTRI